MPKIEISIRCSTGTKFTAEADSADTVAELKQKRVDGSSVPAAQQRLIYKGRILKDTLPLLKEAGIELLEDPSASRKLIFDTTRDDVRIIVIRATDGSCSRIV